MSESGPLAIPEAALQVLEAGERNERVALFVIVGPPQRFPSGGRVLVRNGELLGSFGDRAADQKALELAERGLRGNTKVLPGLLDLPTETGAEIQVYLELHHPTAEMVIVGAGHLAQPLCSLGSLLGLKVRVLDDRPDFATLERFPEALDVRRVNFSDPFADTPLHPWSHVILVTRGHRHDYECLRAVLKHRPQPGYIGMIGSRRRVRATFQALLEEGVSRTLVSTVHAPIGLDIGAETPAEIAVSVAAELVHHWRAGSGRPLSEKERILERLVPGRSQVALDQTTEEEE